MSLPDPAPTALPRLSQRHHAMLLEMGVRVWWPAAKAPTTAPPAPVPAQAPNPAPRPPEQTRRKSTPQPIPRPNRVTILAGQAETAHAPTEPEDPASLADTNDTNDLTALEAAVQACTRCRLASCRQRAVPGQGDPRPDWLIIGEAPGEEEDRQGLPFVGASGQLLDRMLAAMALERTHKVYITNVIKCRPPSNRNPEAAEIAQCRPYLLRQIELLRPKMLVAMGRFAAQSLLGAVADHASATGVREQPLGKLRGRVHQVAVGALALPLVVTYHPAYLLRSPAEKAKAWADLCLAMDAMDTVQDGQVAR